MFSLVSCFIISSFLLTSSCGMLNNVHHPIPIYGPVSTDRVIFPPSPNSWKIQIGKIAVGTVVHKPIDPALPWGQDFLSTRFEGPRSARECEKWADSHNISRNEVALTKYNLRSWSCVHPYRMEDYITGEVWSYQDNGNHDYRYQPKDIEKVQCILAPDMISQDELHYENANYSDEYGKHFFLQKMDLTEKIFKTFAEWKEDLLADEQKQRRAEQLREDQFAASNGLGRWWNIIFRGNNSADEQNLLNQYRCVHPRNFTIRAFSGAQEFKFENVLIEGSVVNDDIIGEALKKKILEQEIFDTPLGSLSSFHSIGKSLLTDSLRDDLTSDPDLLTSVSETLKDALSETALPLLASQTPETVSHALVQNRWRDETYADGYESPKILGIQNVLFPRIVCSHENYLNFNCQIILKKVPYVVEQYSFCTTRTRTEEILISASSPSHFEEYVEITGRYFRERMRKVETEDPADQQSERGLPDSIIIGFTEAKHGWNKKSKQGRRWGFPSDGFFKSVSA